MGLDGQAGITKTDDLLFAAKARKNLELLVFSGGADWLVNAGKRLSVIVDAHKVIILRALA